MIKIGQQFKFNGGNGEFNIISQSGTFKVIDIKEDLISFMSIHENKGITLQGEYFKMFMEEYLIFEEMKNKKPLTNS